MAPRILDPEHRRRLPPWLDEDERARFGAAPGRLDGLLAAGRLLRSDQLDPALGEPLRAWVVGVGAEGRARAATETAGRLDRLAEVLEQAPTARRPGWAWEVVVARDDVESLLWVLGLVRAPEEAALVARAARLDSRWSRLESDFARDLWRAPGPDDRRWLLPLARSSEPAWWLDPLVVGRVREQALTWLTRPLAGARLRVVVVPRPGPGARPSPPEALVDAWAESVGEPVARLADGALTVHVLDPADAGPGLLVREAEPLAALECFLAPGGPPPVRGTRAVWIPLAPTGTPPALVVRWTGAGGTSEARLALRWRPA